MACRLAGHIRPRRGTGFEGGAARGHAVVAATPAPARIPSLDGSRLPVLNHSSVSTPLLGEGGGRQPTAAYKPRRAGDGPAGQTRYRETKARRPGPPRSPRSGDRRTRSVHPLQPPVRPRSQCGSRWRRSGRRSGELRVLVAVGHSPGERRPPGFRSSTGAAIQTDVSTRVTGAAGSAPAATGPRCRSLI